MHEIWGWHRGILDDSGLVGYDAVTFGVCFLKFWGNVVPPPSVTDPRRLEASFRNQFTKLGVYVNDHVLQASVLWVWFIEA